MRWVLAGLAIVLAYGSPALAGAESAAPSSPLPSPAPTPEFSIEPGGIVLHGTVVGHGQRLWGNEVAAVADVSMDLSLGLSAHHAWSDGTFSIAGAATYDCHWSDSDSGTFHWDSDDPYVESEEGQAHVSVAVSLDYMDYVFPELDTFIVYTESYIDREGGTCGWDINFPTEAEYPLSVQVPSCLREVKRTSATTWEGACTEQAGDVSETTTWTAYFEALTLP